MALIFHFKLCFPQHKQEKCINLVLENAMTYCWSTFGLFFCGHPLGKKKVKRPEKKQQKNGTEMINTGETLLLSPVVLFLCPLFQEDNERRQARLRVKSKVNWWQENVSQFLPITHEGYAALGKTRCQNICRVLASFL